jgi:hypothetical protein
MTFVLLLFVVGLLERLLGFESSAFVVELEVAGAI